MQWINQILTTIPFSENNELNEENVEDQVREEEREPEEDEENEGKKMNKKIAPVLHKVKKHQLLLLWITRENIWEKIYRLANEIRCI